MKHHFLLQKSEFLKFMPGVRRGRFRFAYPANMKIFRWDVFRRFQVSAIGA